MKQRVIEPVPWSEGHEAASSRWSYVRNRVRIIVLRSKPLI